ncbi:MAG: helix-turn-helix domain-containing protein [Candidatus Methanomethylophilaceae archaeon]|nr:helix-turn-helix domain-containing protein [Candidatus Methanomethylophilaceae archaeon]MBR4225566.1 helix-turn-helix domain-containing protein [Candidatus Methanomethylophilaceae archaeon]
MKITEKELEEKNGVNRLVPRYRTINAAVKAIKAADPESGISSSLVRRAIDRGEFKAKRIGNRYLIDLDSLLEYLSERGEQ